ncbi:hypothetical protein DFS34DRAFT_597814 [Phlyctochytrium arcticum]|nr:hypothetical protein DFS34DRAFT_597814 [Phlyctochytrium arcticum]
MASLFGISRSTTEKEITTEDATVDGADSPSMPERMEDDIPMEEVDAALPGTETSCMHFLVRSKLGWIVWKEMEASLYAMFERAFAATRCEMKFSDSMEEFGFEVELPNEQVEKFTKIFKSRSLELEIDRLHGLDPLLTKFKDAKLQNLKKTLGTTLKDTDVRSSLEVLHTRFRALEAVGLNRDKEINAIQEQFNYMQTTMNQRFESVQKRFQTKMEDAVWKKMQNVEKDIRASVQEDLAVLNLDPMAAHRTEGGEAAAVAAAVTDTKPKVETTADEKIAGLTERTEAAERRLADVEKEREAYQKREDDLQNKLAVAQYEISRLSPIRSPSGAEILPAGTTKSETDDDKNEKAAQAEAALAEIRSERDALLIKYDKSTAEINRLKLEVYDLNQKLKIVEAEREAYKADVHSSVQAAVDASNVPKDRQSSRQEMVTPTDDYQSANTGSPPPLKRHETPTFESTPTESSPSADTPQTPQRKTSVPADDPWREGL